MKKKIFMLFMLCFTFVLASCNKGNSAPSARTSDNVSESYLEKYHLNNLTKSVNEIDKTDNYRYEIYVAENTSESLVLYSKNIDSLIEKHGDRNLKVTSSSYTFANESVNGEEYSYSTKFTNEELNKVLSVLNEVKKVEDKEYTVYTNLIGDLSFNYYNKENPSAAAITNATYSATAAITCKNDNKSVYFNQVLLPVMVKRYYESSCVLESYLFVPVYSCFAVKNGDAWQELSEDNGSYKLADINFGLTDTTLNLVDGTLLLLTGNEKNPKYSN